MSRIKSRGYVKRDSRGTKVRQTGRTGHSLESCPTVPWSEETFQVISDYEMISWEMESKWGSDRLHTLVDESLGRKFLAQREMWLKARRSSNESAMQKHGRGMIKAYQVLDADAVKRGSEVIDRQDYWSYKIEGIEVRLVKTDAEMPSRKDDGVAYLSVPELMHFVPKTVLELKETFAGSKITEMSHKPVEDENDIEL